MAGRINIVRRKALVFGILTPFLASGIYVGWRSQLARRADQQEVLMRSIAHLGGQFSLDTQFADPPTYGPPQWLKKMIGERLFANIVSINLGTTEVNDGALERLAMLHHLQSLGIWQTHIGDAGLAAISRLAELETLDISQTDVSDEGLRTLGELVRMRMLVVGGSRLTDRGLEYLKRMSKLEMLCIVGDQFTGPAKSDLQQSLPDTTVVFVPLPKVAGNGLQRGPSGNQVKPPIQVQPPNPPASPDQKPVPPRATFT